MSNYTKATNFASKDALTTGNPLKTLSGTELDDEYNNIAVAVATKANSSNTALTGTPTAPTAATTTNSTQIATTAFVQANDALQADLASPTFTGVPSAPTAAVSTNTTQIATTAFVQAATPTAAVINALVYPVGSIYTAIVSTNPATLLGVGTWAAFGAGRSLVGIDTGDTDFDTVEETGGAKTHTLSSSEMPSHSHTIAGRTGGNTSGNTLQHWIDSSYVGTSSVTTATSSNVLSSTGGDGSHNNLQPYITVYFWKRTA